MRAEKNREEETKKFTSKIPPEPKYLLQILQGRKELNDKSLVDKQ